MCEFSDEIINESRRRIRNEDHASEPDPARVIEQTCGVERGCVDHDSDRGEHMLQEPDRGWLDDCYLEVVARMGLIDAVVLVVAQRGS